MRVANVKICGRKEPGYPQIEASIPFEGVEDLLFKIDLEAEKMEWRKIDVTIKPEGLTDQEILKLEKEDCVIWDF
jgi:hypothetical protein